MAESPEPSWLRYLRRRMLLKHNANSTALDTELRRCLNTRQLTLLGLGPTIGVGIFVLPGHMARDIAGKVDYSSGI